MSECIESILNQSFTDYEIILIDDGSTDNSLEICRYYEENVGAIENIKQVYQLARGKYIAHMDGDDLALANKLQKQYEKMEQGFAICSHNVCSINVDNNIDSNFWNFNEGVYDWRYYLKNLPFFTHSSKMFVREHLVDFLQKLEGNTYDFELHLESVKHGLIYHIGENLGVYRLNVGLMVNDKQILIKMIDTKIRVYEKSLSYFNDFMFVKKAICWLCLRC